MRLVPKLLTAAAVVVVIALGVMWRKGILQFGPLTSTVHAPTVGQPRGTQPSEAQKKNEPEAMKASRGSDKQTKGPGERQFLFQEGELLEYRVRWASFLNSARVEMRVEERRKFYGKEAWHLKTTARTLDPVRLIFQMDDQFDSYIDVRTLETLQYEMHLDEQGKKEERILRLGRAGEAPWTDQTMVQVAPGTRDPLAFLYSLRAVDWEKEKEVRASVYDGRKMYEAVVQRESLNETVSVAAGNSAAMKLSVKVFDRGKEVAGTKFQVWLAKNEKRTPLKIDAEVPFGSLRVELVKQN